MIFWDRNLAGYFQLALLTVFFILLIIRRDQLGKGIAYFISANGVIAFIHIFIFTIRNGWPTFNSFALYSVAINFFVFLLYFLYFRQILIHKTNRSINLILSCIFVLAYISFLIFDHLFFSEFPLQLYYVEVIFLLINIFLVLQETFNSEKILHITSYYPFWACIGLMSIYLGVTPLLIIAKHPDTILDVNVFFLILFIVILIGYSILISGIFYSNNFHKQSGPD